MYYKYTFHNNEEWECEYEEPIFSLEKIPFEEFKKIVHKAYKDCQKEQSNTRGIPYNQVKEKVLENDKRFFIPEVEHVATAFIGGIHNPDEYDGTEHISKIRYIREWRR